MLVRESYPIMTGLASPLVKTRTHVDMPELPRLET